MIVFDRLFLGADLILDLLVVFGIVLVVVVVVVVSAVLEHQSTLVEMNLDGTFDDDVNDIVVIVVLSTQLPPHWWCIPTMLNMIVAWWMF